jgi:hypothetical protein
MRGVSSGKVVAKQDNSIVISCGHTCYENHKSSWLVSLIVAFRLRLPLAVNQCFTSTARAAIPSNSAKVCGDSVN